MFWWVAEILGLPRNPEVLLCYENAAVILGVGHRRNAWACAKLHLKLPRQMSRAQRFFVFRPGLVLLNSHVIATRATGRLRDSWVGTGINSCSCLSRAPGRVFGQWAVLPASREQPPISAARRGLLAGEIPGSQISTSSLESLRFKASAELIVKIGLKITMLWWACWHCWGCSSLGY